MSDIRSRPNTPDWYANFDRIFRGDKTQLCRVCQKPGTDADPILIGQLHHDCHIEIRPTERD